MSITRSENMARIRGQDTGPERLLSEALKAAGIQASPHQKTNFGKPDFVIPDRQLAIFIDGCFWHGCPDHYVRPGSREDYWAERLRVNVARDRRQTLALEAAGWAVLRFWEHELFTDLAGVLTRVKDGAEARPGEARPPAWRVDQVEVLDSVNRIERRCLVDLREPSCRQEIVGRRRTTQWRRPRARTMLNSSPSPRDPDATP